MGLFEIATRAKSKARIALTGPSGSGKTLSALYLAYGFTGDWGRIALIDTEHERGRFYAGRDDLKTGAFLYASLTPPYSAERYINYVNEASKAVGEDGVVIIDSFSHAWDNEGGVLDYKSEIAKRQGKNEYTAWADAGKVQNNLVNTILSTPCHTIITMRAKMAYAMELNDKGKTVPVKIGLAVKKSTGWLLVDEGTGAGNSPQNFITIKKTLQIPQLATVQERPSPKDPITSYLAGIAHIVNVMTKLPE